MGYLPAGGFMYLSTSKTLTVNILKRVILELCSSYGDIQPFFDDVALKKNAELWQEIVIEWTKTYRAEFQDAHGKVGSDESLSHIKYAGSLLFAFTQSGDEGVKACLVNGILPDRTKDLVEGFPNEVLMFMSVYWLFNEQQYQRADAKLLYNHRAPPLNPTA